MADIICQNCGNIVQPEDLFCQKCGIPITLRTFQPEPDETPLPEMGKGGLDSIGVEAKINPSKGNNYQPKSSDKAAGKSSAKGTYLFWLLGALIGGAIVGSIEYSLGRASTYEGALLYGLLLSLAWILGSNLKGEQNYGRLNVFIIIVFVAPIVYLLATGNWWIGPEPKGRAMNLGESLISIVVVYVMMFVLGACSLGLAHLWNIIRRQSESQDGESEPPGKPDEQIETSEVKQILQRSSMQGEHLGAITGATKVKCLHCGEDHPQDILFCPLSGKKIVIPTICPGCGEQVDSNWQYCGHCARKLIQAEGETKQQERQAALNLPTPLMSTGFSKERRSSRKVPWLILAGGIALVLIIMAAVFSPLWKGANRNVGIPIPTSIPAATIAPTSVPPKPAQPIGTIYTKVSPKDGMVMLYVAAGDFMMGSTEGDNEAGNNEKPQHTIWLDTYWFYRTEVTNAMYARCVTDGACPPSQFANDNAFNDADQPVVGVDWNDANAYCAWAGLRLPTEAEWEKAARGSDGRIYPWGNQPPDAQLLNYNNNVGITTTVGSYPAGASAYGALDMAGNVWEWVADRYDPGYYSISPSRNPVGPDLGDGRVLRGGSWSYNGVWFVRTTVRNAFMPSYWSFDLGFRCATSDTEISSTPFVPTMATTVTLPPDTPIPIPNAAEGYAWQTPSISFNNGGAWGAIIQQSDTSMVVNGWRTNASGDSVYSGMADSFIEVDMQGLTSKISFPMDSKQWTLVNPAPLPRVAIAIMGETPIALVSPHAPSCFTETGIVCVVFENQEFISLDGKMDTGNFIIGIEQESWSSSSNIYYLEVQTSTDTWIGQVDLR